MELHSRAARARRTATPLAMATPLTTVANPTAHSSLCVPQSTMTSSSTQDTHLDHAHQSHLVTSANSTHMPLPLSEAAQLIGDIPDSSQQLPWVLNLILITTQHYL